MMERGKRLLWTGVLLYVLFIVWTILIQTVDVQPAGETGTEVGFASFNCWFHEWTGVRMTLYTITDWLGLIPVFICFVFGVVGFMQMIRRKSLLKVDRDILLLGVYYILVILGYLIFEMISINYRPILIEGRMEASYPSSTTLLVLGVMPTLSFQTERRLRGKRGKAAIYVLSVLFSLFMVIGRLLSGVHWITDIAGSVLLSMGLFFVYQGVVLSYCKEK